MNLVSTLLPLEHVLLDLDASSKKRLFEQVGLLFENTRQIPRARVFDSLFDREKLGSTGLGYGVAVPHGRVKGLKEPMCAFVKTAAPIPFESPDGEPVDIIFLLLGPEHASGDHLKALARISRLLRDPKALERLRATRDQEALFAVLTEQTASHAA